MRSIIIHTSFISQSWADESTFTKVKNILDFLKIENVYTYPSNIAGFLENDKLCDQVLNNIKKINPKLAIHTNYCPGSEPTKVIFSKNHDVAEVKKALSIDSVRDQAIFMPYLPSHIHTASDLILYLRMSPAHIIPLFPFVFGNSEVEEQLILSNIQKAKEANLITKEMIDYAEYDRNRRLAIEAIFNNDYGIIGLQKKLFTLPDIDPIEMSVLRQLISKDGIEYLEKTKQSLSEINNKYLMYIPQSRYMVEKYILTLLIEWKKSNLHEVKKEECKSQGMMDSKEIVKPDAHSSKAIEVKKSEPLRLKHFLDNYHQKPDVKLDDLVDYLSNTKREGNPEFEVLRKESLLRKKVVTYILSKPRSEIRAFIEQGDTLLIAWIKTPRNDKGSHIRQWFGKSHTSSFDKLLAAAGVTLKSYNQCVMKK